MHRRDFLRPRHFASAAAPVIGAVLDLPDDDAPRDDVSLVRFGRRCMATGFEVVFPFGTPDAAERARQTFDRLDQLESQLTVYRDSSEVCHLNRLAPYQPVRVEQGLFALLQLAAELTALTGGAFDVTAGALIKAWGFYRGPRRVPSRAERHSALEKTGMRHVVLDAVRRTVYYLRAGLEINLGSIGKGYALDRVATWLRESSDADPGFRPNAENSGATGSVLGTRASHAETFNASTSLPGDMATSSWPCLPSGDRHGHAKPWPCHPAHSSATPVLLQGGFSSVYAMGSPTRDGRGWPIDIKHPWQPERHLARLWLRDRGLGTSAATFQYFEHEGRRLGHVLDPRSGWPAAGVASATVTAPTAAEADALSTAFFVAGPDVARAVCAARPDIGCVLLPEGDDARLLVLNLAPTECSIPADAPAALPTAD
jgi:thiamine biosynthesis lipoprotein